MWFGRWHGKSCSVWYAAWQRVQVFMDTRPVSYKALQVIMILYNYSKDQDYINEISLITTYQ